MKLKVGDKVRILDGKGVRSDAGVGWIDRMNYSVGLETRITHIHNAWGFFYCKLNIDQGRWSYDMEFLEKVRG